MSPGAAPAVSRPGPPGHGADRPAGTDRSGAAGRGSGYLDLPGTRLHYEWLGSGPVVVMIPGAAGCAEPYRPLASHLASRHTVITYDRRGFSRSDLIGPRDLDRRLQSDADDVAALIHHMTTGPAAVFGNSSGAIVALELLTRHPDSVRRVVAHEAPLMRELADGPDWIDRFYALYATYRRSGTETAMAEFRQQSFPESDRQVMAKVPVNEFSVANGVYWFEQELRQYPAIAVDHGALLRQRDKLVLAVGEDSHGYPCCEATAALALARTLGQSPVELPGGHVGFVAQAGDFASALEPLLD